MTIPIWPTSLPQRMNVSGYTEKTANNTISSQPDSGPAKVRRRMTSNIIPITGTLVVTTAQKLTLDTFYNTDLFSGSLRFQWVHQITGATVEYRFTAPLQYSSLSLTRLSVTLALEILP